MRDETEQARSIRFPAYVWAALDLDAKRCRRSPVRQLEALLVKWYRLDDVEIHLEEFRETRPPTVEEERANVNYDAAM